MEEKEEIKLYYKEKKEQKKQQHYLKKQMAYGLIYKEKIETSKQENIKNNVRKKEKQNQYKKIFNIDFICGVLSYNFLR